VLKKANTSTRLLDMTEKILGSRGAMCRELDCSEADLDSWRSGAVEPPWVPFSRMVEILIAFQRKTIEAHKEALQRLKERK
jgi:hypothetical protein